VVGGANPENLSGVVVGGRWETAGVRGMTGTLTIGERVAWYRRRRGLSQEVLAGLVGRTPDWLSRVENNHLHLDRLSVIRSLAEALDIAVGDLLAEPSLLDWGPDGRRRTVPALRDALMDYRRLTPLLDEPGPGADQRGLDAIGRDIDEVWRAYQAARFGYVTSRLPGLLADAQRAADASSGEDPARAHALLALAYQTAATTLTKVGEADLAWIAADRGLTAARRCADPVIVASLLRSVAHALTSNGRFTAAVQLTQDAAGHLAGDLVRSGPAYQSVYGTLFLAGSMAAARAEDRAVTREFLAEADRAAALLGRDANYLWTAFGPTNVAIHRVSTAMELGDLQVALDLGPRVDTAAMPTERRVRHALEVARAYSVGNRADQALSVLLDAEAVAPEQVRYHYLSRQLVLTWIRNLRGQPSYQLAGLAQRLHFVEPLRP